MQYVVVPMTPNQYILCSRENFSSTRARRRTLLPLMENSSPLQSLTLSSPRTACPFPPHRRRPLRSRTYDSLIRILSHCMQGAVREEGGSTTCSQVIATNVLVSPNVNESEDKVVRETSEGATKEKTGFQDSDSKQTKLLQPELVRKSEPKLTPSNQISIEDYLIVEEHTNDSSVLSIKEIENVYNVLDVQMEDFDALRDVRIDKDSSFHHSNETNYNFDSDMVVEASEARQLSQEEDTVLEENLSKDVEHELQMKEMELKKLIYSSGKTEVSICQISPEIEEGEISGDTAVADVSFNVLSEGASLGQGTTTNLHSTKGSIDDLLLEDKDRGYQLHGVSNLTQLNKVNNESDVTKAKCRIPAKQLQDDIPCRSRVGTPKSNDIHQCLYNLTPSGELHQDNTSGDQISLSTEMDQDAGKNKRKRGMSKEKRAKKKKKERLKRAEKNRELGVKRLKLPTVLKQKKIVYCRHYLQGRCHEGEKCKFSHDTVPMTKSKPCGHFARHSCMKGDLCPYDHELSKYPCNNYSLNGFCNRGSECMFSHEMAAKSPSATSSVPKHDLISPQPAVPEKRGSYPISKGNKSEVKSPSPLNNPNCSRPMDTSGISHQNVNSKLCSVANSPAQTEQLALKSVLRTGNQAPRGVTFLLNGTVPLGDCDTNKDKQDESSAKSDGSGSGCKATLAVPGGMSELNGMSAVVAPRKPQGINFLSFGQPPRDDSSNKILSKLFSKYNDGMGKSAADDVGKGKLTCSLTHSAGTPNVNMQMIGSCTSLVSNMTDKANGTSLTVPQNVKFLSFNRSHLDESTSKETPNLDSSKCNTTLSFVEERQNTSKLKDTTGTLFPSSGGWSANLSSSFKTSRFSSTPSLVWKAIDSTLAFASQLEPDIKAGSSTFTSS